jgi:transposase InsO family protein
LGLPKSTYYRWLRRQVERRLQDKKGGSTIPWNKLMPEEEAIILTRAHASPELSSRQFNDYLRLVGIRHIVASPYHPQTNGKIERYHRTIKAEIKLTPYDMPSELKKAIRALIEYL